MKKTDLDLDAILLKYKEATEEYLTIDEVLKLKTGTKIELTIISNTGQKIFDTYIDRIIPQEDEEKTQVHFIHFSSWFSIANYEKEWRLRFFK